MDWKREHLEALQKAFPDRTPDEGADCREIDRQVGAQRVVRWVAAQVATRPQEL